MNGLREDTEVLHYDGPNPSRRVRSMQCAVFHLPRIAS